MEIIFKHIWIMCIAATVGNGIILKYRSRKYILDNPELKAGYDNFFKGGVLLWKYSLDNYWDWTSFRINARYI